MSTSLYFKDQSKKYLLLVNKDLYEGVCKSSFYVAAEKNVTDEQNSPYVLLLSNLHQNFNVNITLSHQFLSLLFNHKKEPKEILKKVYINMR